MRTEYTLHIHSILYSCIVYQCSLANAIKYWNIWSTKIMRICSHLWFRFLSIFLSSVGVQRTHTHTHYVSKTILKYLKYSTLQTGIWTETKRAFDWLDLKERCHNRIWTIKYYPSSELKETNSNERKVRDMEEKWILVFAFCVLCDSPHKFIQKQSEQKHRIWKKVRTFDVTILRINNFFFFFWWNDSIRFRPCRTFVFSQTREIQWRINYNCARNKVKMSLRCTYAEQHQRKNILFRV